MQTIVQDYGPIYGEVVNGTVQGRPNGSVYVPITNTITLAVTGKLTIVIQSNGVHTLRTAAGRFSYVAESQDLASNVEIEVFDDSDLTNSIKKWSGPAGLFNQSFNNLGSVDDDLTITTNATYYVIARLVNNSSPVAVSEVVEVLGA